MTACSPLLPLASFCAIGPLRHHQIHPKSKRQGTTHRNERERTDQSDPLRIEA
uniref:Uncharacterized protein n=1 Tax=Arundo donax TaxID=35708 RepID=A0A0A9E805_ARUDO